MYRELTASDIRTMLGVSPDYTVDALLTFGTYPKSRAYPSFERALTELGIPVAYETISNEFFGDIRSIVTPHGRLWFDAIYGCAYASELVHTASLLGAKAIIHLGSFGALQPDILSGDMLVPTQAYGDESTTRMYARTHTESFFLADTELRSELMNVLGGETRSGSVISIQSMLAETREDVRSWSEQGHSGVEMECAGIFATAKHFTVPAVAALYAADNLVKELLVTSPEYTDANTQRESARDLLYIAAIKTLLGRMKK